MQLWLRYGCDMVAVTVAVAVVDSVRLRLQLRLFVVRYNGAVAVVIFLWLQ